MTHPLVVIGILIVLLAGCGRAGDLVRPERSPEEPPSPGLETDPPYQF